MEADMDNDTRGWIMCAVSSIACVVGASIICVDILVRRIPSKRDFRIQDSNAFLAASLSLSFGVMIFSALYSMLPSSKKYLVKSGLSASGAAWILLFCFTAGFVGIQVVSRFLHRYIPSHVVDCDHNHEEASHDGHSHHQSRRHSHGSHDRSRRPSHISKVPTETGPKVTESTSLLHAENGVNGGPSPNSLPPSRGRDDGANLRRHSDNPERRPSLVHVRTRVMSFVKDTKTNCDEGGPCYGYTDPCGKECFKLIGAKSVPNLRYPNLRSITGSFFKRNARQIPPTLEEGEENASNISTVSIGSPVTRAAQSREQMEEGCDSDEDLEAQHHHHVPENAFMSIGLQTSIAIALHKLPEGFITYATNHANPSLGFSVFMALFIHNITEGFALALPLFLALGSRVRAMLWASLLGGVSQPLGAGIAAAWFKISRHEGQRPDSALYGSMFAVTAGIMASVSMQLFVESLSLNHNKNLCISCGFIGMAIMGMSNALTSE